MIVNVQQSSFVGIMFIVDGLVFCWKWGARWDGI